MNADVTVGAARCRGRRLDRGLRRGRRRLYREFDLAAPLHRRLLASARGRGHRGVLLHGLRDRTRAPRPRPPGADARALAGAGRAPARGQRRRRPARARRRGGARERAHRDRGALQHLLDQVSARPIDVRVGDRRVGAPLPGCGRGRRRADRAHLGHAAVALVAVCLLPGQGGGRRARAGRPGARGERPPVARLRRPAGDPGQQHRLVPAALAGVRGPAPALPGAAGARRRRRPDRGRGRVARAGIIDAVGPETFTYRELVERSARLSARGPGSCPFRSGRSRRSAAPPACRCTTPS